MNFQDIKTDVQTNVMPKTSIKPFLIGAPLLNLLDLVEMVNVLTSESELILDKTGYYTFEEGTSSVWTLPPLVNSAMRRYLIMNEADGPITVNTYSIGDKIFAGGIPATNITVGVGEIAVLYNNTKSWFRQL